MIVKFKDFIPRTKVYRARKHKCEICIQLDLSKRRYDLLKETRSRIKDVDSVEYVFVEINCSLRFRFKNGRFRVFNSSENLKEALSEDWFCLTFRLLFCMLIFSEWHMFSFIYGSVTFIISQLKTNPKFFVIMEKCIFLSLKNRFHFF